MKKLSSDVEEVKKRVMSSLQRVHDMAANDRRAATVKADLISARKKRSDMSGPESVYVNYDTYKNRNTGNGPSGNGPMKIVGLKHIKTSGLFSFL